MAEYRSGNVKRSTDQPTKGQPWVLLIVVCIALIVAVSVWLNPPKTEQAPPVDPVALLADKAGGYAIDRLPDGFEWQQCRVPRTGAEVKRLRKSDYEVRHHIETDDGQRLDYRAELRIDDDGRVRLLEIEWAHIAELQRLERLAVTAADIMAAAEVGEDGGRNIITPLGGAIVVRAEDGIYTVHHHVIKPGGKRIDFTASVQIDDGGTAHVLDLRMEGDR